MEGLSQKPEDSIEHQRFAEEINRMAENDQQMRKKSLSGGEWDSNIDANNTARMKEIISRMGWPTISKVGEKASSNAWLLVQHADRDVKFQSECLTLMKQEPEGEVALKNIAMLEDRVCANKGEPQMYGTQFRQTDKEHKPLPIRDEEHVDERRKKMGLSSLEEGISEMYKTYPFTHD